METVKYFGGCSRVVRTDLGTENTRVRDIQRFLRRNGDDGMAGDNAFIQGASTSNQRIEQWWGFLRTGLTCSIRWKSTGNLTAHTLMSILSSFASCI